MLNLFRLLENGTMEMFSVGERSKNKHKFGGTKAFEAEEIREYFINPKVENEVFGKCVNYVICSLDSTILYLTRPCCASQNPFQNNMGCESSIRTILYINGEFPKYVSVSVSICIKELLL